MKLIELGVQPIWHLTTRDRNRIALQSEVLAAASLGIDAVMCMSGYHPALSDSPDSANVYDIDSVQLIDTVRRMRDESTLINGEAIDGSFDMTIGAVANPCLEPVELNIIKQIKKANAGAVFFQTQAVFDTACCSRWLNAVRKEGLHEKTAIIASILPLSSADEAESLLDRYTNFVIPENIIDRLKKAGGQEEQKIEGMAIFKETAAFLRGQEGIRGLHILSGGKEENIESYYKALDNQ
jgi:methylenetetrahydrofolate reductase (NADPH)